MSWGWWKVGDPAPIVAIAIGVNEEGGTHSGLVYRADETGNKLRLLHLRFHHLLGDHSFSAKSGKADNAQYHLLIPNRPKAMLEAVALRCRHIANNWPSIPFGFSQTRITFDNKGRMHAPSDNRGLNCATFVLRVLESCGVHLINVASWKTRQEDESRYNQLLVNLKSYINKRYGQDKVALAEQMKYVEKIAPDVKSVRVRPEEVAGCCLSTSFPVQYSEGEIFGREVLSKITEQIVTAPESPTQSLNPPATSELANSMELVPTQQSQNTTPQKP